jgi:hypothetical protein
VAALTYRRVGALETRTLAEAGEAIQFVFGTTQLTPPTRSDIKCIIRATRMEIHLMPLYSPPMLTIVVAATTVLLVRAARKGTNTGTRADVQVDRDSFDLCYCDA